MARVRSVLIDNTIGRIFRNTPSVSNATAANLIAGTKVESASIKASAKTIVRPTLNIGKGTGIYFAGGALINLLQLTAAQASAGDAIIVKVKVGYTYLESTEVGSYQLMALNKAVVYSVSITVPVGQSVFFDITQGGSTKTGLGLGVRVDFFRG